MTGLLCCVLATPPPTREPLVWRGQTDGGNGRQFPFCHLPVVSELVHSLVGWFILHA